MKSVWRRTEPTSVQSDGLRPDELLSGMEKAPGLVAIVPAVVLERR